MWINPALKKCSNVVSNSIKQADKIISETQPKPSNSVCEKMTQIDKNIFEMYLYGRKFRTGITQKEINELFKKEGNDFLASAYNLLTAKMNFPEEIRPAIYLNTCNGDNIMQYNYINHSIFIDPPKIEGLSKAQLYGMLRHELQHCKQNYMVLRDENIGPMATEKYARMLTNAERKNIEILIQAPIEEVENLNINMQDYNNIKNLYYNDPKGYEQLFENNYQTYKQQFDNIREQVIAKFGVIKEGSKESKQAKLYFDDFTNDMTYYNSDGTVNAARYLSKITEQEATLADSMAECEVTGQCFFKNAKEETLEAMKNQEFMDKVKVECQNAENNYNNVLNKE